MTSDLTASLTILSAMITPAILILACGSLILTTSQRLSRVIDRTRKVAAQFEALAQTQTDEALLAEERAALFDQLGRATDRTQLLQRTMTCLYLALSAFMATSVTIGVIALAGQQHAWLPLLLVAVGMGLMFAASLFLVLETYIALAAVDEEMRFVLRHSQHYAPAELLKRRKTPGWRILRPK